VRGGNGLFARVGPGGVGGANSDQIFDQADAADVPAITGGPAAGTNYGAIMRFNSTMYDALRQSYTCRCILIGSRAAPALILQRNLQDLRIHPNAAGVKADCRDMGPAVLDFVNSLAAD